MSRAAVDRVDNSSYFGGNSRIPRPFGQSQTGIMQNGQTAPGRKPSRLQQLQSDYQQRLLKEKEEKLIHMYEETQTRALNRVNQQNKGMVRNFFNERRNLSGEVGSPLQPTMDHMYRQKKQEHSRVAAQHFGYRGQNGHNQPAGYGGVKKSSAGRDRSNPLAPIQRNSPNENPFPSRPQIVRPRTMKEPTSKPMGDQGSGPIPKSAPSKNYPTDLPDEDDDSPPPNLQQLKYLQQKRLQSQRSNRSGATVSSPSKSTRGQQPLTDFQKWQQEQNRERDERLQKHRMASHPPPPDDEGYDDDEVDETVSSAETEMARKQQELMAQIQAQQAELDRLRREREREEVQEAKEAERRRKFEEERKRRLHEEEEQRKREEEDERMKRQWEEEKQRKIQEEKRRMRKMSDRYDSDEDSGGTRPAPPPGPKPQNSRKAAQHQPPPTRKVAPPAASPPPFKSGDHTQFYEQAIRDSDAYESGSVNLVSCYNCGRKFADDRIDKHQKFCKNLTKKRKVMDPTKLRTAGTELEKYVNHRAPSPKAKKNNWRAKHESFINSIRYAKKVTKMESEGVSLANLPPPPPSENPDYVQCPYCTRRFNPTTAERHIPHCKNTKSRPAPPRARR